MIGGEFEGFRDFILDLHPVVIEWCLGCGTGDYLAFTVHASG
jgi:hypothetical protein